MPTEVFIGVDVCKPRLDLMSLPTGEILEQETAVVATHFLLTFWGVPIFFEVTGLAATAGVGDHELSVLEQLRIGHYHEHFKLLRK